MASTGINFIIDNFNTEITMDLSGSLLAALVTMDTSCVAELYVDASAVRSAFQFQSDASDVLDASGSDIKYFVNREQFWSYDAGHSFNINVADAQVKYTEVSVPIMDADGTPTKNMVCHDFVRYLALKLFNTAYGVDLFNNERELLDNIRKQSQKVWATIDNELIKYDITSRTSLGTVSHGVTYDTQETPEGFLGVNNYYINSHVDNISKKLLDQMAYHDSARLSNIQDTVDIQPIPFVDGDTISLKLTINPASGQEDLTSVTAFGGRTFRIRFKLIENYNPLHSVEQARDPEEYTAYREFAPPVIL